MNFKSNSIYNGIKKIRYLGINLTKYIYNFNAKLQNTAEKN